MKDILEFNSIEISDTGIGFNEENLKRLRSIYDESKSFNNLGTGRIQYLHFLIRQIYIVRIRKMES